MQQHDVDDTTTRKTDQARPGHQIHMALEKLKISKENKGLGLGEEMQSSNEATQRYLQRQASPTSKYQLFERHGRQYHHMVFEGEPAVKLHTMNVAVVTSSNGNPRQDQITMGRVHSPGSTNH